MQRAAPQHENCCICAWNNFCRTRGSALVRRVCVWGKLAAALRPQTERSTLYATSATIISIHPTRVSSQHCFFFHHAKVQLSHGTEIITAWQNSGHSRAHYYANLIDARWGLFRKTHGPRKRKALPKINSLHDREREIVTIRRQQRGKLEGDDWRREIWRHERRALKNNNEKVAWGRLVCLTARARRRLRRRLQLG